MTDLAGSSAILLVLWGTIVGLDLVSVPQAMLARPVVAGAVAGAERRQQDAVAEIPGGDDQLIVDPAQVRQVIGGAGPRTGAHLQQRGLLDAGHQRHGVAEEVVDAAEARLRLVVLP